jgi:hypothetical protein
MNKKNHVGVSRSEIAKALEYFLSKGGEIEIIEPIKEKNPSQAYPEDYMHKIEGEANDISIFG